MYDRDRWEDEVEQLIDGVGLSEVLAALARICHAKADHVASTWQDEELAQVWSQDAQVIERLLTKVRN